MGREGEDGGRHSFWLAGLPASCGEGPGPSDQSQDGARHRKSQSEHKPRGNSAGEQKAEFSH